MEVDSASAPQPLTILRIKRKRNEEPLDALVVESRVRRKKSRGGVGVFQFAQTVEHDAWQDESQQKYIQDQISRIARETASKTDSKSETKLSKGSTSRASSPTVTRQSKDETIRRYTILKPDNEETPTRAATHPPKVISSKDLPPKSSHPDVKMFDAVLTAENKKVSAHDAEMDKFLPMLNDYLKLHEDFSPIAELPPTHPSTLLPSISKSDDYVWDVFYHRPATLSEWNEAANIGTLTGLPPSITDPYDSASDSEEEDEADEDSNAEEYYKNDYPEEDESSDSTGSDAFHEDSDHEDMMYYEDDGDDHEWR